MVEAVRLVPDVKDGRVAIRPAKASDKRPVLDFCRNTWPGGDYIPDVWGQWISDPKGALLVATVRGVPVGLGHYYFQTRNVVWLEGMRVHPAHRGRGIAGRVNRALTRHAVAKGAVLARMCTGIQNVASQRHAEKVGFKILQRFDRLDSVKALQRKPANVSQIRKYKPGLWKKVLHWTGFSEFSGLYSDGWTWHPITFHSLQDAAGDSRVLVTSLNGDISSVTIVSTDEKGLTLGFFAGDSVQAGNVARYSRCKLAEGSLQRVRALIPHGSSLMGVFGKAGFKPTNSILVYEKRLRPSRERNKGE